VLSTCTVPFRGEFTLTPKCKSQQIPEGSLRNGSTQWFKVQKEFLHVPGAMYQRELCSVYRDRGTAGVASVEYLDLVATDLVPPALVSDLRESPQEVLTTSVGCWA
jgi:hypothetical protein